MSKKIRDNSDYRQITHVDVDSDSNGSYLVTYARWADGEELTEAELRAVPRGLVENYLIYEDTFSISADGEHAGYLD